MTLTVAGIDGAEYILEIDPWTRVSTIKVELEEKTGIPPADQRLAIGNVVLDEPDRMISHYTNKQHERAMLVRVGSAPAAAAATETGDE